MRALRAAGHELRLLVRNAEKATRLFGAETPELIAGDMTDPVAVDAALRGADAVVHAAAVVAMDARHADQLARTNPLGVEHVVGGAVRRGLESIVYVSSATVLFTPGAGPIRADSPLATGSSGYARSKVEAELRVRELQRRGAPIRTLYPQAILGPDDPGLSESNRALRIFLRNGMVDTSGGFEIVDVRDVAALIAALVRPEADPGGYLPPGDFRTWPELIALLEQWTGRRVRRVPAPARLLLALGRLGDAVKRWVPFDFPLSLEAMRLASQWPGSVPSQDLARSGVTFRDAEQTYRDTVRWLVRAGHLSRRKAGRLAD